MGEVCRAKDTRLDRIVAIKETEPLDEAASDTPLPTMSSPLTEQGTILGTYPYMAPEQLEGKPTDAPTDPFSPGRAAVRDGDG